MYFLNLWWRNAKGVFWSLFIDLSYASPYVWAVHLVLLPITMTLGALIKTIFDVWTRNPMSDIDKIQLLAAVKNVEAEKLNEICVKLTGTHESVSCCGTGTEPDYILYSNSSKKLIKDLSTIDKNVSLILEQKSSEETKKLTIAQLTTESIPNPEKAYREDFIKNTKLNVSNQSKLEAFNNQTKIDLMKEKSDLQKGFIHTYITDEKNDGKNLQQIIKNMFFTNNEETLQRTNEGSHLNNIV